MCPLRQGPEPGATATCLYCAARVLSQTLVDMVAEATAAVSRNQRRCLQFRSRTQARLLATRRRQRGAPAGVACMQPVLPTRMRAYMLDASVVAGLRQSILRVQRSCGTITRCTCRRSLRAARMRSCNASVARSGVLQRGNIAHMCGTPILARMHTPRTCVPSCNGQSQSWQAEPALLALVYGVMHVHATCAGGRVGGRSGLIPSLMCHPSSSQLKRCARGAP